MTLGEVAASRTDGVHEVVQAWHELVDDRLVHRWPERLGEGRVRTDHAPANLATIKHMALNLTRPAPGKDSLRVKRKVAARDDDVLADVITA